MKVLQLNRRSIKPYGYIIDASRVKYKPGDNGFGVLFREHSSGWRIAYLVVRNKKITRLERHTNTSETFEPITGKAIIALSSGANPERYKVFILDKPIILKKGIWHNVASITKNCEIKICEGIKVCEDHHNLRSPISL
jgi:ureidoglycolate hydrolase